VTEEEWEKKWSVREAVNWLQKLVDQEVKDITPGMAIKRSRTRKESMVNVKTYVIKDHMRRLLEYSIRRMLTVNLADTAVQNRMIKSIGDKAESIMYQAIGEKVMVSRTKLMKRSRGVDRSVHENEIEKYVKLSLELDDWSDRDKVDVGLWWIAGIVEEGSLFELVGEPAHVRVREEVWDWLSKQDRKKKTVVLSRPWLIEKPRTPFEPYVMADLNKKAITRGMNKEVMAEPLRMLAEQHWRVDEEMLFRWEKSREAFLYWKYPRGEELRGEGLEGKVLAKTLEKNGLTKRRRIKRAVERAKDRKLSEFLQDSKDKDVYFGWMSDWRGRMYPTASVNLQGSKLVRALLNFAEGSRVTVQSTWDVKVTIAGYWGIRGTLEDRVDWVDRQEDMIRRIRMGSDDWMPAKEPWLFLRACLELGRKEYRMPVPVDGSNNAYQHLAALTGNRGLAKATNCVDSERPRDLYGELAGVLEKMLKEEDLMYNWMDWLGRDEMKEVCLAAVYKQSFRTVYEKIESIMREKEGGVYYPDVKTVSKVIYKQIGREYLTMKRDLLRELEYPLETWDGFKVMPNKLEPEKGKCKQYQVRNSGMFITGGEPVNMWEKVKEVHVIHANDACHMRMVLRKFPHARMIHDEFAGRAGERSELQRVTRDEFVRMYKGRQMVEGWDVEEVRNAKYFFD
jgi:hypothetical protein